MLVLLNEILLAFRKKFETKSLKLRNLFLQHDHGWLSGGSGLRTRETSHEDNYDGSERT